MNVLCAICQDTLDPSHDVHITPCGHVFHFPCLIQWLEKAASCPECRQKVKRDRIIRIYFNFCNTEAIKEDSFTLQQRIDSLEFKIKLKEKEYKNLAEEVVTLRRQNVGLREEVKKVESEVTHKNSVISGLKQQTQYFKQQSEDYDKILREKRALESKIETYDNVKMLVCATSDEVDQMLSRTSDANTLSTYVAIMKRELSTCLEKRKELRNNVRRLQQELQSIKIERNSVADDYIKQIELLENELAMCKSQNDALKKQLSELKSEGDNSEKVAENTETEKASKTLVKLPSRKRDTDMLFDIDDMLMPKKMKQSSNKLKTSFSSKDLNDSDVVFVSPRTKKTKENEENSPYLPTKSRSLLTSKERSSQRSGFSIKPRPLLSSKKSDSSVSFKAFKKSRNEDSSIAFDGFGGHSKIDTFPQKSPSKLKRSASDSSKNKKLKLDTSNNKQLDDYVINLT